MASKQQPSPSAASGRLWGGRFTGIVSELLTIPTVSDAPNSGPTDPLMEAYNESIHFDRAFFAQDVAGSIAYARANVGTGILTQDEFVMIEKGLRQVLEEWRHNRFEIRPGIDEDIHTANERRLGEIIGKETAGKLHTSVLSTERISDLGLTLQTVEGVAMTRLLQIFDYGCVMSCARLKNILQTYS